MNIPGLESYDFSKGVPIEENTVIDWIKSNLDKLEGGHSASLSYSGNTCVIGVNLEDRIEIYVCKNFELFTKFKPLVPILKKPNLYTSL